MPGKMVQALLEPQNNIAVSSSTDEAQCGDLIQALTMRITLVDYTVLNSDQLEYGSTSNLERLKDVKKGWKSHDSYLIYRKALPDLALLWLVFSSNGQAWLGGVSTHDRPRKPNSRSTGEVLSFRLLARTIGSLSLV